MLFDFLLIKNKENMRVIMKPLQKAVFLCKAGGYMLLCLLLGRFPLYTGGSSYSPEEGMIFMLITMILIALFMFWVPWGRLDNIGVS